MFVHRLTRVKQEIKAQEAAVELRRRALVTGYRGLVAYNHRRLASPTALVSSFSTGLIVGTWMQRTRRARDPLTSRRQHSGLLASSWAAIPWASVARTFASSALLQLLRKAGGLFDSH
jgi:hypothetical protein